MKRRTRRRNLLPQPEGIDVDSEGNVFVNEIGENRINIFKCPMARSNPLGARRARNLGQFSHPHGNEVEDENNEDVNNVYVYTAIKIMTGFRSSLRMERLSLLGARKVKEMGNFYIRTE